MTVQKEEKAKVRLKVAEADKREVGRGIARINERHIKEIGAAYGDVVQITGRRSTTRPRSPPSSPSYCRWCTRRACHRIKPWKHA